MENKKIKIVIKGPVGSGKTTFLSKISDNIEDNVYHEIEINDKKVSIGVTNNLNVFDEKPDIIIHINSLENFDENFSSDDHDHSILNLFNDNLNDLRFPKHNDNIDLKNVDSNEIKSILNNLISKK